MNQLETTLVEMAYQYMSIAINTDPTRRVTQQDESMAELVSGEMTAQQWKRHRLDELHNAIRDGQTICALAFTDSGLSKQAATELRLIDEELIKISIDTRIKRGPPVFEDEKKPRRHQPRKYRMEGPPKCLVSATLLPVPFSGSALSEET